MWTIIRDVWRCPACGAGFVQRNLAHSCVRTSLAAFLREKPRGGVRLFRRLVAEARKLGPVTLHPVKTRVALMVEVRFAAVYRFGEDAIDGHLWLKQRVDSGKFRKIEDLLGKDFIHHFRMEAPAFLDDEFRRYLAMAYAIGRREHLSPRRSRKSPVSRSV
jgi:hypothetical protein